MESIRVLALLRVVGVCAITINGLGRLSQQAAQNNINSQNELQYTSAHLPGGVNMAILVTGGAGFIGSHACVALLQAGEAVVALDNFSNSSPAALQRVEQVAGKPLCFQQGDLRDKPMLDALFKQHPVEAVIHFAGLKAVGESSEKPLLYYRNNVEGSLNLLAAMELAGVRNLIFSSSATVYGDPDQTPIKEGASIRPTNPYGHTKAMIEQILMDQAKQTGWRTALLRYFNPVGAHPSGQMGEDPKGIPNNLLPYISKVAVGVLKELSVFGSDYPTVDGTGVRDYIHVMDLVEGHLAALKWLRKQTPTEPVCEVFNLGVGKGYSVLEVLRAFEQASGEKVPYKVVGRRPGDIATCYADANKAEKILGWKAVRTLDDAMRDTWCWQKNNPDGYR